MDDTTKQAFEDQLKAYRKLENIKDTAEFKDFFEFQVKLVVDRILWTFMSGKEGDNVKNWDDFCKVRGQIMASLIPIQEIYGATALKQQVKQQIDSYYRQDAQ